MRNYILLMGLIVGCVMTSSMPYMANKNKLLVFDSGIITDSIFYEKLDSVLRLNKYYNDTYLYISTLTNDQINNMYDSRGRKINRLSSDTIYMEISSRKTIYDNLYSDYIAIKYKNKIVLFPPSLNGVLIKKNDIVRIKYDYIEDQKEWDLFVTKQRYHQVVGYSKGVFKDYPKGTFVYGCFTE